MLAFLPFHLRNRRHLRMNELPILGSTHRGFHVTRRVKRQPFLTWFKSVESVICGSNRLVQGDIRKIRNHPIGGSDYEGNPVLTGN